MAHPATITVPEREKETVSTASPSFETSRSHGMLSFERPLFRPESRAGLNGCDRCLDEHVRNERRRSPLGLSLVGVAARLMEGEPRLNDLRDSRRLNGLKLRSLPRRFQVLEVRRVGRAAPASAAPTSDMRFGLLAKLAQGCGLRKRKREFGRFGERLFLLRQRSLLGRSLGNGRRDFTSRCGSNLCLIRFGTINNSIGKQTSENTTYGHCILYVLQDQHRHRHRQPVGPRLDLAWPLYIRVHAHDMLQLV